LGHFWVAKKGGIRVDEFAIGFPPKIFSWVRGETKYILNLIPFGGYVKIYGENPDTDSISGPDSARSFVNAPKWKQICVLVAGVGMNIIFAWLLISISFMFGSLIPINEDLPDYSKYVNDKQVILTGVLKDSPAEKAGLERGDKLIQVGTLLEKDLTTDLIRQEIENVSTAQIAITYNRQGEITPTFISPELNLTENRKVIGIYMENVAVVRLNPFLALWEGGKMTIITFKPKVFWAFFTKSDFPLNSIVYYKLIFYKY